MSRISHADLLETLLALRDQYGAYHHHKEQIAFSGAAIYITGCIAFVADPGDLFKRIHVSDSGTFFVVLAIASMGFVAWQLWNREKARSHVERLENLIFKMLSGEHSDVVDYVREKASRMFLTFSTPKWEEYFGRRFGDAGVMVVMFFATMLAAIAFRSRAIQL